MISRALVFLLVLSVHSLVNGQACSRRSTVEILRTCQKRCIQYDKTTDCYTCNSLCSRRPGNTNTCDPSMSSSCERDAVCLAVGIAGQNTCVNRIAEGQSCGRQSNNGGGLVDDVTERMAKVNFTSRIMERVAISSIPVAVVPCRNGLVCKRESLNAYVCQEANQTACFRQKLENSEVSCNDEGNFEALQCRRQSNSRFKCQCVTSNGTDINGTQRTISNMRDAPNCANRKCSYVTRLGRRYEAASGTRFIDYGRCAHCLCFAGEADFCSPQNMTICDMINPSPKVDQYCSIRGRRVSHGESISIGCTRCRCRNGRIQCLKRVCDDGKDIDPVDEEARNCQDCGNMAVRPVCGNDGKTYPSECIATNCRELNASDITSGPCRAKNFCQVYQCSADEVCVKRGGVTCLSKYGCRNAQLFRGCVNLRFLQCNSTSNDSAVCGNDGNSYSSLCSLLQTAAGVKALYGGRCDAAECAGGQVCGTDGETYSNRCELQAQSANARVDYQGECMETAPGTLEKDRCQKIRTSGKCQNTSNCKTVVRPDDGCCFICGGGLTIGFDGDALEEYLTINPSLETVDDLMVSAFLSGLISEEDRSRCEVKGSLSNEGNLFIAFEAKQKSEDYCYNLAKKLEGMINNTPTNSTASVSTSLPQEFQFATVAETSALVSEEPTGSAGGQAIMRGISLLIIMSLLMTFIFS